MDLTDGKGKAPLGENGANRTGVETSTKKDHQNGNDKQRNPSYRKGETMDISQGLVEQKGDAKPSSADVLKGRNTNSEQGKLVFP